MGLFILMKWYLTVIVIFLTLLHASESDYLDIADVRLVNGSGSFSGRVEASINGVWGTFCGDSFDINDANVICRMLNLKASAFATNAQFGQGTGPVFAQEVRCNGAETQLNQCNFITSGICTHAEDVGVFCTECGELTIAYGKAHSISRDGTELTVSCNTGYQLEVNSTVCQDETWSLSPVTCTSGEIQDVRLADGLGLYDGRIEVLINNTWGTVCGNSYSYYDATTVCYVLFGIRSYVWRSSTSSTYTEGAGPPIISKLGCSAYTTNINECDVRTDVTCSQSYAVVACYVYPLNVTDIQLADGTGRYDGRVELKVDGHWGTISNIRIGLYDAMTLCNMLNLSFAAYFKTTVYGKGTGPVLIREMRCYSAKDHINSCSYYNPYSTVYSHSYDLSLVCTACGLPNITNGDAVSFNGTELTVKCQTGSTPDVITMTCHENGTWLQELTCSSIYDFPLSISEVRLSESSYPFEGRAEVLVDGTWGTICAKNIGQMDAGVICQMLGLRYESHYTQDKDDSLYSLKSGPIYIDELQCNGTEAHINNCSYDLSNSCTHYDDLSVACTGYQLNITDIRLAGTPGPYHGRVEIQVNGTWGTVGDYRFYHQEAYTVCSMFGLRYKDYIHNSYYGSGSGPNYIDKLDCLSYYDHINDCKYVVGAVYNTNHQDDASVICYGPELNITEARLADGTGPFDGRAEIKVNDTWGTICDSNFGILDADLFCDMLGLRAVQVFTGAIYGGGSGPIYMDQLFCGTSDSELSKCRYLYLNSCTHDMDVSVVCNECGQPDIAFWGTGYFTFSESILFADCSYYNNYIGTLQMTCNNVTQTWETEGQCQEYSYPLNITDTRLADGPNSSSGRVEIKSLDTWGTVCDHSFGMTEAHVICRMLGFPPAVTFYNGANYGPGTGPIFVDDLNCEEDAAELNDCSYNTYDNCGHEEDVSVVCTDCGDPTPLNGFVNTSSTSYETKVHITCERNYDLIGESDIFCQLNGIWSGNATCKLIDCGDPSPEHGSRNTTVTTNGTVVLIECEEGYNMSGDAVITCQQDESWTDFPSCEIIDCNTPEPENADVTLVDNRTTFGETAIIDCWEGYTENGSNSPIVSCLSNGTWEVWSDCVPVDCGNPVPNKGSSNTTETTFGSVVKITCPPGYNISGDSVIICQSDKQWTDNPVCDTSDCGLLSLANGKANTSLGTSTGSMATVECDEGYTLTGPSSAICTASGWNDSSIACEIEVCEDPTPSNGKVSNTDGSDGYVFGDYAEIECNVGYKLIGESVIICEDGDDEGVWSNQPTCALRDCGELYAPVDGIIDDSKGTKYPAQITYSCNEGFLLVGDDRTTCNENGDWTNAPPICVQKSDVGGICQSEAYCLFEDSQCLNSICTCVTGIYDETAQKCNIMPLLPYGTSVGDTSVPKTQSCGTKVTFDLGFPAFSSKLKDVYICWFGFLSLGSVYSNPTPPGNKKSVLNIGRNNILAPFYAPINKRKSKALFVRSFDISSSYEKMKENKELISYIEMIVRKFANVDSFDASFVLIATWDEAKPLKGFDTSKTSTFQVVLTSDGKTTYAFYIYGYGKMQWVNNLSNGPKVWVGYSVDRITNTHAYSFTDPVLHLDSKLSAVTSENDVTGLVFKPLTQPGTQHEHPAVDCINWYNDNNEDKKRLDFIASMTPECPCDIWLSRFDPWFWRIGLQRRRTDITYACVDMPHVRIFGHYGKRCCYDLRSSLWVNERPYAGGFQLYNTQFPLENILNDVIPKTKCCFESDYCNLYYKMRPTGSCYKTSPYDFGIFWGDPHFRTLDGMNFTFNGLGEYVLLQVRENKTFDLHARTERPVKEDGSLSEATIFTAFAAKDSTNASVHVELNKEKKGIILYGNNVDLTNQYLKSKTSEDPFEWTSDDQNLVISKRDETLSVLFPSFGISLNISVSVEMLSLNTLVNKTLKSHTQGLLGNYNGDPDDDFTLPNGTVLNSNLTEREVFEYGKNWAIDANNSAFIYDNGKSHFDYRNDSYVPKFLDEADPDKVAEAEKVCNGSQNIQCVFDLVFIEKPEVAMKTNDIKAKSDTTRSELDESVPSLTVCETVVAKKGEQVTCSFTADENDEVYFVNNSVEAKIDRESSVVVYKQQNEDPVSIRIASKNNKGRSSTTLVIDVLLCTGCSKHGNCTKFPRNDDRENEYFKIAACDCEPEYEGPDCEDEFDGCAANPCSLNRTCSKLPVKDQKLLGRSYNCSDCPNGYVVNGEDITDCSDIDECSASTGICQHMCTNTEGSFECSCTIGYRLDSKDSSKCRDINECEEGLHNCTHVCNNTVGSFTCQCFTGFYINAVTGACNQTEVAACPTTDIDACYDTDGCTLENEVPVCFCREGYELDSTGEHCEDIDECNRGICPQNCVNTDGDFECVCYPGYKLEDRTTCEECDVLHWGKNCTQDCVCTGRGANRCDNVKGCVCDPGWQGDTCNDDIDECASQIQVCDDSRKKCVNNLGSYSCECKVGFVETKHGTCTDLDECLDPRLNKCSQICKNTFGSYSCKCNAGYTKENETTCKDIDECKLGISLCDQICVNDPGKHSCRCNFGYTLSDDRESCIKISDPCLEINNLTCTHFCLVDSNSAKCSCRVGYRLESDTETCTDINECEETDGNQCDINANCTNTDGSFMCECPAGLQLENDGRTCTECDNYHFGKNCLQNCSCLYGTCDKNTGCECDPGWGGAFCDSDIDECDTNQLICNGVNTVCVNTLGSAECSCKTGYTNTSGVCTDIDECSDIHLNSCDQVCNNTEGSYICSCRPGFILKDICTDIDECSGSHGCDQVCENTAGSYRCSCEDDFTLNRSDRRSCRPENECSQQENSTCQEHSICYRQNGNVICACVKGYQNTNVDVCEDIDECEGETNPCSDNCLNTDGSFVCNCSIGQYLTDDEITCQECTLWKYGYDCLDDCTCNKTNTILCNPVDGQCDCKSGWTGDLCESDIDECIEEDSCPENSNCSNTVGNFSCKCNDGYFKTGGGLCEECDPKHFGENCLQECNCNLENTADCKHKTGECVCKEEWTGEGCSVDVDECETIPDVCQDKSNSTCKNSQGSFICECDTGFLEDDSHCEACRDWTYGLNCESSCLCNTSNTGTCDTKTGDCMCKSGWNGTTCQSDIDECDSEEICPENSICENTEGSFDCLCDIGYFKTATSECQVCEEGRFGENCNKSCLCVAEKTDTCDHETGNCSCRIGWKGQLCAVDIDECESNQDACIDKPNSTCNNTAGSFVCKCDDGFRDANGICQDIDECIEENDSCSQTCNNTNGSFMCSCTTGYVLHEDNVSCQECTDNYYGSNCSEQCRCNMSNTLNCHHVTGNCTCKEGWEGITCSTDINECTENVTLCLDKANSTCQNTNGSYRCACNDGFREQADICTDCNIWKFGKECQLNCTCDIFRSKYCDPKSGSCTCEPGWTGTNCTEDIDECIDDEICPKFSSCNNTDGSFSCTCVKGYYKTDTDKCEVCDEYHFGDSCTEECTCDTENTDTCHHVSGACTCKMGWKGDNCTIDVNECEENSNICDQKTNSTCNNTAGSFICQCDTGFSEDEDNTCKVCNAGQFGENCSEVCKCYENTTLSCHHVHGSCSCKKEWKGDACSIDVNECEENTSICIQKTNSTCNNTAGSFICDCNEGFYEDENYICLDINECDQGDHGCLQSCVNTIGDYFCECSPGYEGTGNNCTECEEWEYGKNCAFSCNCNKSNTETCDSQKGKCACKAGWNGTECNDDVNECNNDTACPANSKCLNIIGSYTCSCLMGYFNTLDDECQVCNDGQFGENCSELCECNVNTTLECNHVNGTCSCKQGWKGDACSIDVNECEENTSICIQKTNSTCNNTAGSFICDCNEGFYEDENYICLDINECDQGDHGCLQSCVNTIGDYFCECSPGYEGTGNNCTECEEWEYGKNCAFSCNCNKSNTEACDSQKGKCACKAGWNGTECNDDVNECNNDTACPANSKCLNIIGSYTCSCLMGYFNTLDDECQVCNDGQFGENCSELCECNVNTTLECNHVNGTCSCKQGWKGDACSIDVNECEENTSICIQKTNSTCNNTAGSFICDCNEGFYEDENYICLDINECDQGDHGCLQSCVNTIGDYFCECSPGYEGTGNNCTECEEWEYGKNCAFSCNCNKSNTEACDSQKGKCACKAGWNGTECNDDVNECNNDTACPANSKCLNIIGSYTCSCLMGYFNTLDDECQVCNDGQFGENCSELCECNVNTTLECNHVNGTCSCKQGWKGDACSIDVNECEENTSICIQKTNSTCNNTAGSFICDCNEGFYEDENYICLDINECDQGDHGCLQSCVNTIGDYFCECSPGYEGTGNNCTECEEWEYGKNCAFSCNCNKSNTEACDSQKGKCACKAGWNGTECNDDVNECNNDTACPANSKCLNIIGSYTCSCLMGYFNTLDDECQVCNDGQFGENCSELCECNVNTTLECNHVNGTCSCKQGWKGETCKIDVNECEENTSVCIEKANSTCNNTAGFFLCDCNEGFYEDGNNTCLECEEWEYGKNCAFSCNCKKSNTEACDNETGKCTCKAGWNGTECNDDINDCNNDTACPVNSECLNINGSYNCKCVTGYINTLDGECQECSENTFGENCTGQCNCHVTNSENKDQTCNTVTGQCKCKSNWKGETCTEDVDECVNDKTLCINDGNKTCVNTDGWYNCDCIRGFTKTFDQSCIKDFSQTTQKPVGDIIIPLTVTLEFNLPDETNLNASSIYENLQEKCVVSFMEFVQRFVSQVVSQSIQVIVNDIRFGSLIVDYSIVYGTKDETVASQLAEAVVNLQQGSYFMFDGQNVSVLSESYKGLEPCDVYQETIGSCGDGHSCTAENGVPLCKPVEEKSSVNWSMIIGLSAAGLTLLVVTAILLVCAWRFCAKRTKTPFLKPRPYPEDRFRSHLRNNFRSSPAQNLGSYPEQNLESYSKQNIGSYPEQEYISYSAPHVFQRDFDEASDFYRIQRLERGKVVDAGMRNPTSTSIMRPADNFNVFQQPYHIPRARMTPSREGTEDFQY